MSRFWEVLLKDHGVHSLPCSVDGHWGFSIIIEKIQRPCDCVLHVYLKYLKGWDVLSHLASLIALF